jgi:hypothetical protein
LGDVTSTNIRNDRWIPNGICFKLVCHQDGAATEWVCDLFNQVGRSWNDGALAANVILMDAVAVKCIPLGRITDDF